MTADNNGAKPYGLGHYFRPGPFKGYGGFLRRLAFVPGSSCNQVPTPLQTIFTEKPSRLAKLPSLCASKTPFQPSLKEEVAESSSKENSTSIVTSRVFPSHSRVNNVMLTAESAELLATHLPKAMKDPGLTSVRHNTPEQSTTAPYSTSPVFSDIPFAFHELTASSIIKGINSEISSATHAPVINRAQHVLSHLEISPSIGSTNIVGPPQSPIVPSTDTLSDKFSACTPSSESSCKTSNEELDAVSSIQMEHQLVSANSASIRTQAKITAPPTVTKSFSPLTTTSKITSTLSTTTFRPISTSSELSSLKFGNSLRTISSVETPGLTRKLEKTQPSTSISVYLSSRLNLSSTESTTVHPTVPVAFSANILSAAPPRGEASQLLSRTSNSLVATESSLPSNYQAAPYQNSNLTLATPAAPESLIACSFTTTPTPKGTVRMCSSNGSSEAYFNKPSLPEVLSGSLPDKDVATVSAPISINAIPASSLFSTRLPPATSLETSVTTQQPTPLTLTPVSTSSSEYPSSCDGIATVLPPSLDNSALYSSFNGCLNSENTGSSTKALCQPRSQLNGATVTFAVTPSPQTTVFEQKLTPPPKYELSHIASPLIPLGINSPAIRPFVDPRLLYQGAQQAPPLSLPAGLGQPLQMFPPMGTIGAPIAPNILSSNSALTPFGEPGTAGAPNMYSILDAPGADDFGGTTSPQMTLNSLGGSAVRPHSLADTVRAEGIDNPVEMREYSPLSQSLFPFSSQRLNAHYPRLYDYSNLMLRPRLARSPFANGLASLAHLKHKASRKKI
ncbi:hypothetical protein AB6A40_000329 [Gnathostoma spinigerum]|uniref:Uncharacterized protein n=1 Tax=Gnathostoma spinigerum TaxID=75299 RepID=A0ABD6EBG4_9BILA